MAKRRRVKPGFKLPATATSMVAEADESADTRESSNGKPLDALSIAAGLFSGALVYVAYYPSDSVAVENGDALWFSLLALVTAAICLAFGWSRQDWGRSTNVEKALMVMPWCLAAWVMLAAWGTTSFGNLRMATNEAWLWVAAAAMFSSARILGQSLSVRRALTVVAITCSFGLAVHGLHQTFVSLPANRAEYQRDPEHVLELAGVDAPAGSAERMVFENRLFDGGPSGTFALANSLAASLLVGIIAAVGWMRWSGSAKGKAVVASRYNWIAAIAIGLICGGALLATRSRSATLAMLAGVLLVLVGGSISGRNRRALWFGAGVTAALAVGVVLFLATMGNREWFEQAPASLAFRFQYWRSTWQLVLDHPLFGAGPGNFQALYERYREASAHEQIAEPHNFLIETLASSGFVGISLLGVLIAAGAVQVASRSFNHVDESAIVDDRPRWVWLGAILSLAMIWILGFASRRPPDLSANLWIVPLSILTAVVLARMLARCSSAGLDVLWLAIVVAIGIHLSAAGGWTVPGVAISLWLGSGLLTRPSADTDPHKKAVAAPWSPRVAVIGVAVVLIGALYGMSLRPVETRKRLMEEALRTRADRRGAVLERAVQADPWSPEAALWLADWYRWPLVIGGDTPSARQPWTHWLSVAKQRAGSDPAVYRMVGVQQLHLYQRYGRPEDLQAAAESIGTAVQWSPSNQWLMAQMALIAEAQQAQRDQGVPAGPFGSADQASAESLTRRAWELSELGGNIERALSRQQIYLARHLGPQVEKGGPRRAPASELLPKLSTEAISPPHTPTDPQP